MVGGLTVEHVKNGMMITKRSREEPKESEGIPFFASFYLWMDSRDNKKHGWKDHYGKRGGTEVDSNSPTPDPIPELSFRHSTVQNCGRMAEGDNNATEMHKKVSERFPTGGGESTSL